MARLAPRYHPIVLDTVRDLDDRREPIAEICRRIGAHAERAGLTRPSYVHLRRLIQAERAKRDELREIAADVAARAINGRYIDPLLVIDRIEHARRPRS